MFYQAMQRGGQNRRLSAVGKTLLAIPSGRVIWSARQWTLPRN